MAFDQTMAAIARLPVPSSNEQLELGRRVRAWLDHPAGPDEAPPGIRRSGLRARDRLVSRNMRLVASLSTRFMGRGVEVDDLIQEGAIGLQRAAELFDPSRGYQFATFAYWWIRQSMTRAIDALARPIKVSSHSLALVVRMERLEAEWLHTKGRLPSNEQIQEALDITAHQLERVRDAQTARFVMPLDAPVKLADGEVSMAAMITADQLDLTEQLEAREDGELLGQLIAQLPEEQRLAVTLRHDQLTYREIGLILEVPPATARQLEVRGRAQVRRWWTEAGLEPPASMPLAPAVRPPDLSRLVPLPVGAQLLQLELQGGMAPVPLRRHKAAASGRRPARITGGQLALAI